MRVGKNEIIMYRIPPAGIYLMSKNLLEICTEGKEVGKGRAWECLHCAALLQVLQRHWDVHGAVELGVAIKGEQTTCLQSAG